MQSNFRRCTFPGCNEPVGQRAKRCTLHDIKKLSHWHFNVAKILKESSKKIIKNGNKKQKNS